MPAEHEDPFQPDVGIRNLDGDGREDLTISRNGAVGLNIYLYMLPVSVIHVLLHQLHVFLSPRVFKTASISYFTLISEVSY